MVSEVAIATERDKWLALQAMMAIARMKLMMRMRMQPSQATLVWTPPAKLDVGVLTVMVATIRKE
jgi:hypothetical protein